MESGEKRLVKALVNPKTMPELVTETGLKPVSILWYMKYRIEKSDRKIMKSEKNGELAYAIEQ